MKRIVASSDSAADFSNALNTVASVLLDGAEIGVVTLYRFGVISIRHDSTSTTRSFAACLYVHESSNEAVGGNRSDRRKMAAVARNVIPKKADTICLMRFGKPGMRGFVGALLDKEDANYALEPELEKLCSEAQPARGMLVCFRTRYMMGVDSKQTDSYWANGGQTDKEIAERREVYDLMGLTGDTYDSEMER